MRVVFIVGSYRSGTTLLRLMLSQHSRMHFPPETECIPRLLAKYGIDEFEMNSDNAHKAYSAMYESFRKQGWNDLPSKNEVSELLERRFSFPQLYVAMLRAHAIKKGKKDIIWVGDNTPAYVLSIADLADAFEGSKFIHMVRDVRDVYASIRRTSFKSCFNVEACVLEWEERLLHGMAAEKWLGPKRFFSLRYEDLVARPNEILRQICCFLDIEFEDEMLAFYKGEEAQSIAQQGHHKNTVQKVSSESIGRYKKCLTSSEINKITNLARSPLIAYGYETNVATSPPMSNVTKYFHLAQNFFVLLVVRSIDWIRGIIGK